MKREEKKQRTRDLLLETALTLFAAQGYEATTVAQITERAGVAKGTFFNYFQSKEDVLLQIGDAQQAWAAERAEALLAAGGPLAPGLLDLFVALATRLGFTKALIRALFQASLTSPARLDVEVSHGIRFMMALVPLFAAGQEQGEFAAVYRPEVMAELAVQTYFGVLLNWCLRPDEADLGEQVRVSFGALLHGLVRG